MSFPTAVSRLKRRSILGMGGVAVTMALATLASPLQAQDTTLAARTKGSSKAPVTVYEMADFQCPVCRDFAIKLFPALDKEYIATGKVRWIFINFPLTSIHPNAAAAAAFAVCASRQGKFWPTHDMLYNTHDSWEKLKDPGPFFMARIGPLGLKQDAMTGCLQSGVGMAVVKDDAAGSERAGAGSTPSFYIEGGMLPGLYPIEVFRRILDSVYLAKSKPKTPAATHG